MNRDEARKEIQHRVRLGLAAAERKPFGYDASETAMYAVLSAFPEVLAAALPDETVRAMVEAKGWETQGL